mmetsp:Transcript_14608/g.48357  ORF Transcript_14608/g.48357 Transcript_14608/m.48357 type:complete len:209 (-) Transcript_14608:305-931(-)
MSNSSSSSVTRFFNRAISSEAEPDVSSDDASASSVTSPEPAVADESNSASDDDTARPSSPSSTHKSSIAPETLFPTSSELKPRNGRPQSVMPRVSKTKCSRGGSNKYQYATSASSALASLCAAVLCPLLLSCPKSFPHFKTASSSSDRTSPSIRRIKCPCIAIEVHHPCFVASIGRRATFLVPAFAFSVAFLNIMCCRAYTSHTASPR